MQRVPFGATELEVSRLGFGTATYAHNGTERRAVERLLNRILDAGINLIDTAACYPDAEPLIGSSIAHRRDEYVLVTKCGHRVEGVSGDEFSAELVAATVDRALQQMRTDHLDVMLLHSCSLERLERGDAIGALVEAKRAGKVRFVGYSGDNAALSAAVAMPEVEVIETSVSIADQANIDAGVAEAAARNLAVLVKRPVANGAWRAPADIGALSDYASPYADRLREMAVDPAELGYDSGERDTDWVRMTLAFALAVPGVHTAITGSRYWDHMSTNIDISGEAAISPAAFARLRQSFVDAERASGAVWEGLT